MQNHFKNELYPFVSGKNKIRFGTVIQTIAGYFSIGEKASATIAMEKHFTKQETKRLEDYSSESSSSPNIARTN